MKPVVSIEEIEEFLAKEFHQIPIALQIERYTDKGVVIRFCPEESHLRPGNTVSGPTIFTLCDVSMYVALLSRVGLVSLAVTTSAQIDFMRKPKAGLDLIAEVTLKKVGKLLVIGTIDVTNPDSDDVLAQSSMTYAVPPNR